MKKCGRCKILKELSAFTAYKTRKDGVSAYCKICLKRINQASYQKQLDKNRASGRLRYQNKKETMKAYTKCYVKLNRTAVAERQRTYMKQRRNEDVIFRLLTNIRNLIGGSLKRKNHIKKSKTTDILGCSIEQFKAHLEEQFESWMHWGNYGVFDGNSLVGWDIDHIIPVSSAKTEVDLYKLNHYTNLRPLCSHINRIVKRSTF